jgi:hypothetical protein
LDFISGTTITNASYQPIHEYDRVENYKPREVYKAPSVRFEDDTVYKHSYTPCPVPKRENSPWAAKVKYKTPVTPIHGHTVYNDRYA